MSLGKLIGFSGALEQKFALASINFDFSLVRYEAPAEYKELGMALSKQRSREGEEGISHVTARQLGALFEDLIPKTPNLVRAYGLRASEIARSPTYNPKGSPADGIFAEQIGADGTTIWAAATSGSFTIAMHLLACMLARIWDAPQAVSVWTEVISERKRILSQLSVDDPVNLSSIAAAQIRISREQVANWDSGARAWLRTADEAKRLSHTQLLLIINNVGIPVDVEHGVYSSVIHAWQTAMETVEKLLGGEGQSIRIGAPLLALSAWHLYPDMLVLGTTTKSIKQNDELMPFGSLVTLGLQGKDSTDKGIYWSLPLAHLRYYGDPVTSTSTLSLNKSRVSISQFLQVALGAFLTNWGFDELMAAETLALVVKLMQDCPVRERFNLQEVWTSNWVGVLGNAAKDLLQSTEPQRSEYLKLFRAGRRRYKSILAEGESHPPVLGLTLLVAFIEIMKGPEERVRMLRELIANTPQVADVIIQYTIDGRWECASATPSKVLILVISTKRKQNGSPVRYTPMTKYTRWLLRVKDLDLNSGTMSAQSLRQKKYLEDVERLTHRASEIVKMGENVVWVDPDEFPDFANQFKRYDSEAPTGFFDRGYDARKSSGVGGPKKRDFTTLRFLVGDSRIAALYSVKGESCASKCTPTLKLLNQALKRGIVSATRCEANIWKALHGWQGCASHISLCASATVARLYNALPGATIPLEVATKPLNNGKWIPFRHQKGGSKTFGHSYFDLTLEEEFACLVLFDSGGFNLDPSSLKAVMAMSSGNLIFIPKLLLSDPWNDDIRGPSIKSIIGNLGRPGIAMLMAPESPRMRELGHDSWTQISHHPFDGKLEDNFQHTTLHLTFSEYELPIDVGQHGLRDRQIYFLEAPVSVHDHGEWVGDLDVLKALKSGNLRRRPICTEHNGFEREDESFLSRAVSLDNWEELLGSPADTAIVRAHGNWQARLAAMVLSIQRGHTTHVLPHEVCWTCILGGEIEQESTETDHENDELLSRTDDESSIESDDNVSVKNDKDLSIVLIA